MGQRKFIINKKEARFFASDLSAQKMQTLRRTQMLHFDSWAATFGEAVTSMELSPDGKGYRLQTRFARFVNVPELMGQFWQVADVRTAEMFNYPCPSSQRASR